jgi:hypothetical protein
VPNYKLDELLIDTSCRELADHIRTEELKIAVGAFAQNVNRIAASAKLPVSLFYWGSVIGQNFVIAYQDITKEMFEFSKPLNLNENTEKLVEEKERSLTSAMFDTLKNDEIKRAKTEKDGYRELLALLPPEIPLSEQTEGILSSAVIGAWTAFETLASDVWIGAYDALPKEIRGPQNGNQFRIENMMSPEVPRNGHNPAKFNTDGNMRGDEFVESTEMRFSSLEVMRRHYSRLFSEKLQIPETSEIDRTLGDTNLDALHLVRNLLVHKSGVCDAMYVNKFKNNSLAPRLELGRPIKLDGISVLSLVGVVTKLGPQLAKAVDTWTQAAKAK